MSMAFWPSRRRPSLDANNLCWNNCTCRLTTVSKSRKNLMRIALRILIWITSQFQNVILKTCRSAQMWMAMEKVRRRYLVAFVKVNSSHSGRSSMQKENLYHHDKKARLDKQRSNFEPSWYYIVNSVAINAVCKGCGFEHAEEPRGFGTALWGGVQRSHNQCLSWNICATRLQHDSPSSNVMFKVWCLRYLSFDPSPTPFWYPCPGKVGADATTGLPLPQGRHTQVQEWNFQEKTTGKPRVWSFQKDF